MRFDFGAPGFPAEFFWMERGIAFAVLLQTLEHLRLSARISEAGVWKWSILREEFRTWPGPFRRCLDLVLAPKNFGIFLVLRATAAGWALFFPCAWIWAFLLIGGWWIGLRWRGTFNGGSDSMTQIVVGAVFFARAVGPESPRGIAIALAYVAVQVLLSYFIAGLAKLRHRPWRTGEALADFFASDYYAVPLWIRAQVRSATARPWMRWMARSLIAFEFLFPLCLIHPDVCRVAIVLAVLFQLANYAVFGLNRFVFAWGAAYPALYWLAQWKSS